ncbi:hypothetical protein [Vreelandella lutescens]|uniref:Uncharacterized protein n=1 Tax=Vreelandella lutescens TaxID=1602943 RepID=A0ABQ1NGN4_9GAMM|nr:hypothetical protein [Halomonas lutescens]GGC76706.1 hypothetical protein GCM10011382_03230 [Halomonas lutescens]
MNKFDNPFHDLWVTEILSPGEFVKMFSPIVASHAEDLFSTGNVIVKGRQGSGKSMLLGLLNTKTRVAYERAKQPYPAPKGYNNQFISAGVHLIKDNVRIVSSRVNECKENVRKEWAAATFSDYLNFLLLNDLVDNVVYLKEEQIKDNVLSSFLKISINEPEEMVFLKLLKENEVWEGYLNDCHSFLDLVKKIKNRISIYRRYFNFNSDELPREIEASKTIIGEPVAVFAEALRVSGIIPLKTKVFLRIDQHEELYELEKSTGHADVYREVINRALAMRDGRVAYRVGTRHYAWGTNIKVWGSGAHLENMRDYTTIDIDYMFRKHENPSLGAPFEAFAEDVFVRRLEVYSDEFKSDKVNGSMLSYVFGNTLSPQERAKKYVGLKKPSAKFFKGLSEEWVEYLQELWENAPLDAWMLRAWLDQKIQVNKKTSLSSSPENEFDAIAKKYWIKERNEIALVQLAGEMREMVYWSGKRHIVNLSGSNILAFMTICRAVWSAWLRSTSDEDLKRTSLPKIGVDKQMIGIYEASRIWSEKLKEGADGDRRYEFISFLGSWFSKKVRNDKALSNPGHNGFSMLKYDFERNEQDIISLIKSCRDQGDLVESDHTSKSKDGLLRIKWYLHPLLCPYFRIPHIRTKEPIYISSAELEANFSTFVHKSDENISEEVKPIQKDLFGE